MVDTGVPSRYPFTDGIRPRWYPRVSQEKVRRLYESEAAGMLDDDLVNDVGIGLLLRCRSILIATEAHEGRVLCPRCKGIIEHHWDKVAPMVCGGCGWETTWGAYLKTFQGKQLHGGGAVFAFKAYVERYEGARTAQERMLLIDRLLHAFHHELVNNHTRPAAANLIEGRLGEVIAFLDDLTRGETDTPSVREGGETWESKARHSAWLSEAIDAYRRRRALDGD
ncbi:MAG TPA: hypothetical protein VGN26_22515 [Armatimonadota bacterium]|jgi:hypothetical protein